MCCYQSHPYKTAERALASMDKSASQFESVGVSRSCFCISKIKQDSANLASA
ncbi:hypothetical protein [Helicobacter pylori]|uniref:hypothetical protein n=1 Tax=Helicobacter pylori TaxID=210 RepID=UPI001603F271|nr:hypothetical protein [Helicobacter pylori]